MRRAPSVCALAAGLVVLSGCAKQSRPTGGPVDRTAPRVVGQQPSADATQVPLATDVAIEFSESMDRVRTVEAVFVAPSSPVDTDWDGRRLRVRVRGGLATGRTYVITVGTDARDLRGNRLEQSFSYAFTTGDRLDTGTVAGRVIGEDRKTMRGAFVWAYDMEHFGGRTGVDPPAYVTQSGVDGAFRFERLASSRYRVLAFLDGNRNQRPDPGEPVGLPHADVRAAADGAASAGDLVLTAQVGVPRLERASAVDRNRVLLGFDRDVDPGKVELELGALGVVDLYGASGDRRRVYAITEDQEPGSIYRPRVRVDGVDVEPPEEPIRGSEREDQGAPDIVSIRPSGPAAAVDSLVLAFSEAMEPTTLLSAADWLASDSTLTPEGIWRWSGPLSLVFTPGSPLPTGPQRMELRLRGLRDRAGNAPEDTAAVFAFELLPEADRAVVNGIARWPQEDGAVRVELAPEIGDAVTRVADTGGAFAFARLTPGAYVLSAFVDRDGDGEHGTGSLDPYAAAEPFALHGEVSVERGQTVDITLPAPMTAEE